MNGPCIGCTKETGRSVEPNCHMTCTKYLEYIEARNERNKMIFDAKNDERIADNIEFKRIMSVVKKRRRK